MPDTAKTNAPPAAIAGIECEALFGHYTYKLRSASGFDNPVGSQLLLLYGDNGSGKTTIAQLLFHILSPAESRGHLTFLAHTKFRRFSVHFDTGSSLAASREGDRLDGAYTLTVSDVRGNRRSIEVKTSEDNVVKTGDVDDAALRTLLSICLPTPLNIYFLADNRVLQSDVFEDEPSEEWMGRHGSIVTSRVGDTMLRTLVPSSTRELTVAPSVWRAESWMRRQAIQASSAGDVTTTNIYADIIKRLTRRSLDTSADTTGRLAGVLSSLTELAERSKTFTALGLSQPVPIDTISDHIRSGSTVHNELLASILEPYVESIRSRLDAYAVLKQRLSSFLDSINTFYRRKTVRITTTDGIQVFDQNADELDLTWLSSGEKQLMLLLSNILVATTQPSVFIIDEPELSLNVKWQRQLIDALLSLVEGSHVQFVMATHSIELLTRHKECVLKLDHSGGSPASAV